MYSGYGKAIRTWLIIGGVALIALITLLAIF